jgi:hypothetical protein
MEHPEKFLIRLFGKLLQRESQDPDGEHGKRSGGAMARFAPLDFHESPYDLCLFRGS